MPSIATNTKTKSKKEVVKKQSIKTKPSKDIQDLKPKEKLKEKPKEKPLKEKPKAIKDKPVNGKTKSIPNLPEKPKKDKSIKEKPVKSKDKPKKLQSLPANDSSSKSKLVKNIKDKLALVIDIYKSDVYNRPNYSEAQVNEYIDKKIRKEDSRNYITMEVENDDDIIQDKQILTSNSIEFDFHSRSIDINKLMAIDKDNKVSKPKSTTTTIDIEGMQKSIVDKVSQTDDDVEDFFSTSTLEEYIPLSQITAINVDDALKEDDTDTTESDNLFNDLMNDFELSLNAQEAEDTSEIEEVKLTFGEISDETYIEDEPLIMGNEFVETVNLNANLNAIDNLQFEIEEEEL